MNLTKFIDKLNNPQIVRVVLPLIVLLEIGRTFYHTNAVYILSRALLFYFLIFAYTEVKKNKQLKVYIILVLLFALWALATTIWSYDPIVTFPRAFYFAYVAVGAAIAGYLWYAYFSKSFLSFLLPANIIIVVISLVSLITNQPADAWTGGCGIGFMGFAPHQNTLGMMILLTIPAVLFPSLKILNVKFQKSEIINSDFVHVSLLSSISYLLLLLLNIYLLILTQSRGSIISILLMIITFLIFTINWKLLITSGLTLVLFITALFFASPQIRTSVTDYVFKTETVIGDRRTSQIKATLSAAQHGGLIGLGYGISDPQNVIPSEVQAGTRYYREKMISVLALVEEVGVVGLGLFLAIIGYVLWGLINAKGKMLNDKWEGAFMIAVLVALSFDAQVEAWWLGAGSWQFCLFFAIIGCSIGVGKKQ
ncbi:MAG: hypothetical protein A2315_15865 [Ignavibacteria bacterium RIFOXYB2_FULL_35_12]|nr:MAG: hypothetical protein A2058_00955 [Ignavibacteria bacterium GWA2_36_19]OGU60859.1 MAG: hypothetical protein A2X60_15395 [Ignavibacteria bacterium GWF2_35_20]OGU80187.1 MAG: hypothetical protein A2254_02940 [Ignavibacteria bacterium RIFOXYA2_FULL_35_9]OGU92067.1 MAG: hypothetical protein A3K31_12695 [Ignavibacteria bacterium RIFOXYA12_FULL_35_25]OGU98839.1 MAG: hypothetical protein A2455_02575 [Ignavibacteria bacterium RIFOXYC2_FULL_35_16]OGV01923.1 MAG: hypothetical protein A2315_15865 